MDSQNTNTPKRAPQRKRKSKPVNIEHDNNIKQNITKNTKKLKKDKHTNIKPKKIIIASVLTAIFTVSVYFGYNYYINNSSVNLDETSSGKNFSSQYVSRKVQDNLKTFSQEDLQKLRSIIKEQSINSDVVNLANDSTYSDATLVSYLGNDIHIMTPTEKNEYYNGYPEQTTGITLDSAYNIINIVPYSSAWRKGLRLNYRLEQIDGKNLIKGLSNNDINNALTTHASSKWMFNDKQGRRMTIKTLEKENPAGNIAEAWVYQNTLILKINKINIATPSVINSLLSSRFNGNDNIKGIVIDLRNTGDDIYSGLPETAWILNNQQNQTLANVKSRSGTYTIQSENPNINLDTNSIQKFFNLPKIVWVNYNTQGSAEVLANTLKQNGAKLNGDRTADSHFKTDLFQIGNQFISLKNSIVSLPNTKDFYINPENNKAIFFIDMLYQDKRKN